MKHTIRWHGYAWNPRSEQNEKVPRTSMMRGRDWGWDAECSCGWQSRTGGAIEVRIKEAVAQHKQESSPEFQAEVERILASWRQQS